MDEIVRRRDVFISHASEDKEAIARPLAEQLQRDGFTVWFDEYELVLGDSLRSKIGDGLTHSRVGVVILSRSFLAKQWSQWELSGLTARQNSGEQNVILPVWHDVGLDDVRSYSPPLADLVAVRSGDGVRTVADAVERVVRMRVAGANRDDALEVAKTPTRASARGRRAAGVGALGVAAIIGVLVATNPFHGGDRNAAGQSTSRSAFVLPSGSVTITRRPGRTVGGCWEYDGSAHLKTGRTLVIGARRIVPPDTRTYYQQVTWLGEDGRSAWRADRSFGSQPGQTFRVTVVSVPAKAAPTYEPHSELPADAEAERLLPDVMQTSRNKDACIEAG